MVAERTKAVANPTKVFFVRMITRDINLEDCILDLIDNSVDGAWRSEGSRPMGLDQTTDLSKYRIDINASPEQFSIRDNCGGMSLDDAINHAFSFGRNTSDNDDYSIGVYGIGMKRAVFKLGSQIRIRSTYQDRQSKESFSVPIDVNEWLANNNPPWDFDIVSDTDLDEAGVEISVSGLTKGSSTSFESSVFLQNLHRMISRDYSFHLDRGLQISLNGALITGWKIELRQSEQFKPLRVEYEDEIEGETVSVEIIGGMAAPPPETSDPSDDDDGDKRFGWYVVCNGRIVLAADKSTVSGWGTDSWPQWHRQYSGFIGVILINAAKAAALPLTTTKRSVDQSSEIYRRARPRMRDVSRQWIDYTNQRKQDLDEAKLREAKATPVSIYAVPKQASAILPMIKAKASVPLSNVNYSVPTSRLKSLAKELGNINMSHREVGLKSFDYTFSDLVGGD